MRGHLGSILSASASVAVIAAAVLLTACGDDRTQGVEPELVQPIDIIDFGSIPVLVDGTAELSLVNTGRAELKILGLRVEDPPAGQPTVFRVIEPPTFVGPGEEVMVKLAFTPADEVPYEGTLTVLTDDLVIPDVKVKLVGVGNTRAMMSVEPREIDFGRVVEDGFAIQTVTIESHGTADLVIQSLSFTPESSPAFGFFGSASTPVTVKTVGENGLPEQLVLSLKYTVAPGAPDTHEGVLRILSTDPAQREVLIPVHGTVNRAPIAHIAPLGVGSPGMEVTLDARGSSDPDGDLPLSYTWTLRRKPLGADTVITDPAAEVTTMRLDGDTPGEYEVELNVIDAAGGRNLTPARAKIIAQPAEKLRIEMFWENTETDIDLHFLRTPGSSTNTADDCHYKNPAPDWGVLGDSSDDPMLTRDALVGYGPEVVAWVNPVEGTSRIVVVYQDDHETANIPTPVRVRVYQYGVLKAEFRKTLTVELENWVVADVEWPSGNVTAVSQ